MTFTHDDFEDEVHEYVDIKTRIPEQPDIEWEDGTAELDWTFDGHQYLVTVELPEIDAHPSRVANQIDRIEEVMAMDGTLDGMDETVEIDEHSLYVLMMLAKHGFASSPDTHPLSSDHRHEIAKNALAEAGAKIDL